MSVQKKCRWHCGYMFLLILYYGNLQCGTSFNFHGTKTQSVRIASPLKAIALESLRWQLPMSFMQRCVCNPHWTMIIRRDQIMSHLPKVFKVLKHYLCCIYFVSTENEMDRWRNHPSPQVLGEYVAILGFGNVNTSEVVGFFYRRRLCDVLIYQSKSVKTVSRSN